MNENQTTYHHEEEIDLIQLAFSILHKYRQILMTVVICAVLAAGFGLAKNAYSSYAAGKAADSEDVAVAKSAAQQKYDEEMLAYREEKTKHDTNVQQYQEELLENQQAIESTKIKIQNAQEYLDNSVLNTIDPYNVPVAQADLYVSTDYKIMPGMDYQNVDYTDAVLKAYSSLITNSETMDKIAKTVGMEERYLQELVSVSGDSSTRLLTIRAYGADEATANKILDALLVRMEDVRPTIQSTVGSHSIAQLTRTSTVSVMTLLRDSQQQNRDDLTNLQNQVTTLEAADRVLEQSIEDEQQALEAMKLPEKQKETGNSMAKMVILGALLGGVLACGVVVVKFLLDGMVYSASELNRSTGLPVLGALASDRTKKAGKLDAKLYQMEGRPDGSADAEMLCLMAQTIRSRAPEAKNILVTGDLPADQLEALAAALQATEPLRGQSVTAAESILKAAATVPHVVAADAIVLAADCTVTRTDAVREQNEKIVRLGKQILGCIVYE